MSKETISTEAMDTILHLIEEGVKTITAYHGTNQDFKKFTHGIEGITTKGYTSKSGFWFTSSHEEAEQYAKYSNAVNYSNSSEREKKIKDFEMKIARAEKSQNWDLAEKLQGEYEEYELYGTESISFIYTVNLNLKNPIFVESKDIGDKQDSIISKAKKDGYDSVVFNDIKDSPYGMSKPTTQYVVFDLSRIAIVDKTSEVVEESKHTIKKRNIWIPNMSVGKLNKLLTKPKLTDDDKETLCDYRYFLIQMKADATEKGFYEVVNGTNMKGTNGIKVLKNKYWLSNINDRLVDGFTSEYDLEDEQIVEEGKGDSSKKMRQRKAQTKKKLKAKELRSMSMVEIMDATDGLDIAVEFNANMPPEETKEAFITALNEAGELE